MENIREVELLGSIDDIELGGQTFYMSDEEIDYLKNFNLNVKENTDDYFSFITEPEDKVKILFTLKKYNDAWCTISKYIDNIDYSSIITCPYFTIEGSDIYSEVFTILHNRGDIDDKSYAFHNIIYKLYGEDSCEGSEREFIEPDFMASYFGTCTSVKEFFDKLSEAYNGLEARIDYDDIKDILDPLIVENEDLSPYLLKDSLITFDANILYGFIKSNHIFDVKEAFEYIQTTQNWSENDIAIIVRELFELISNTWDDNDPLKDVVIHDFPTFVGIVNYLKDAYDKEYISKIILNSFVYINTPNIATNIIREILGDGEEIQNLQKYKDEKLELYPRNLYYLFIINHNYMPIDPKAYSQLNADGRFISTSPHNVKTIVVDNKEKCLYYGDHDGMKKFDLTGEGKASCYHEIESDSVFNDPSSIQTYGILLEETKLCLVNFLNLL